MAALQLRLSSWAKSASGSLMLPSAASCDISGGRDAPCQRDVCVVCRGCRRDYRGGRCDKRDRREGRKERRRMREVIGSFGRFLLSGEDWS
ncbi:unnamed protein product [Moneuplotes crassus]|uniref:Uncharacterized protein n=1 Tax=Euplotes crassus TaxID=5936 RepID=A0AAD2D8G7_EUPCR|nr:unnamed protein product [Moneuplotes crassus]